MKTKNKNIILEKYSNGFFGGKWKEDDYVKTVSQIVAKAFSKYDEYINDLDNTFIPKKWYSFESLFKKNGKLKPENIKIRGAGTKNTHIVFDLYEELDEETSKKVVYRRSK